MTETPDLRVAEHIGTELRTLSERLAAVSTEFAAFSSTLAFDPAAPPATPPAPAAEPTLTPPTAAPVAPMAAPPVTPQQPYPPRPYPTQEYPAQQYPAQPYPAQQYPAQPYPAQPYPPRAPYAPAPPPPRPPQVPLSQRLSEAAERGLVGRILAAVGVGITLIGVVLLLILAAQAGLLRPEIRLAGGVALAAALIGAGAWIGRREDKRSGAIALVATGIATALFVVLAAASIYDRLPVIPALVLGALIAGGGLWFAHRWDSQALGLMVSVPLLVFAPIVTDGVDATLIAFLLVYATAALWLQVGRDWVWLYIVNTAATTFPLLIAVAMVDSPSDVFLSTAICANLTLALGSAILLLRTSTQWELVALTSVAAATPMLGSAAAFELPLEWIVPAIGAALLAAAAGATIRLSSIRTGVRAVWAVTAAVLMTMAAVLAFDIDFAVPVILAAALVIATIAVFAGDLRRALLAVGTVVTTIGLLALITDHGLEQLLSPTNLAQSDRVSILVAVILGIGVTALLTWAWSREFEEHAEWLWITGSLINLWLVTQLCVAVAALITDGSGQGFRAGHTVATLIWFACAAAALLWALRLSGSTRTAALSAGLALIAGAVAKLFGFDLAALDGVFRVIAFLVAGILLLVLGVAYAQRLTTRDDEPEPQPVPGPGPGPGPLA